MVLKDRDKKTIFFLGILVIPLVSFWSPNQVWSGILAVSLAYCTFNFTLYLGGYKGWTGYAYFAWLCAVLFVPFVANSIKLLFPSGADYSKYTIGQLFSVLENNLLGVVFFISCIIAPLIIDIFSVIITKIREGGSRPSTKKRSMSLKTKL